PERETPVGWSGIRISTVPYFGWGRMSQWIAVYEATTPESQNRLTSASHSDHDAKRGGAPWRGSRPRISARVDSIPVCSPSNHGEFADRARTSGSHGTRCWTTRKHVSASG